jgi:hypothetical protein
VIRHYLCCDGAALAPLVHTRYVFVTPGATLLVAITSLALAASTGDICATIGGTPGLAPGNVRIGRVCRSDRARHFRQHLSNGRIMKRAHPGGPRATRMESSDGLLKRNQHRAQKPENRANRQPFTTGGYTSQFRKTRTSLRKLALISTHW